MSWCFLVEAPEDWFPFKTASNTTQKELMEVHSGVLVRPMSLRFRFQVNVGRCCTRVQLAGDGLTLCKDPTCRLIPCSSCSLPNFGVRIL